MDISSIPCEVGRRRGRLLADMADELGLSTRRLVRYVTGAEVPPRGFEQRAADVLARWDEESGALDDVYLSNRRTVAPAGYSVDSAATIQRTDRFEAL